MDRVAPKVYYSIGEVSALAGLKPHVLRYWETQFPQQLRPAKNRGGTRAYRTREIETILLIRHLLHEKRFTIEGARQELKALRQGGRMESARQLNAQPAVMQLIREGIEELREVLTLPADPPGPARAGVGGRRRDGLPARNDAEAGGASDPSRD